MEKFEFNLRDILIRKRSSAFWAVNIIIIFICYGFELTNSVIGIDDQVVKETIEYFSIEVGRFGLPLINSIFNFEEYLPFFYLSIAVICIVIGNYIFTNIFYYVSGKSFDEKASIIFSAVIISFPYYITKYIFMNNILQTGINYICIALSSYFVYKYAILEKKYFSKSLFIGIVFIWFVVLNDESSIIASMIISLFLLLLYFSKNIENNQNIPKVKQVFLLGIKILFIYILSLIIYKISQIIVLGIFKVEYRNYQGGFVIWTKENFSITLKNIIYYMLNYPIKYPITFISKLIITSGLILMALKTSKKGKTFSPFLIVFSMILLSFSMTIITGNPILIPRAKMYLGEFFAVGIAALYMTIRKYNMKPIKYIFCIFTILLVYYQAKTVNITIYYGYLRANIDYQTAFSINERIKMHSDNYKTKPVVFIGKISTYKINDIPDIEYTDSIPGFFNISMDGLTVHQFFRSLGIPIISPNNDIINKSYKYSVDMDIWPKENSIKETEDAIIVKLGEISYPKEIKYDDYKFSEDIRDIKYSVDNMSVDNNKINCSGWGIYKTNGSAKKYILIKNIETKQTYIVNAVESIRKDVTEVLNDGNNYDYSGFEAEFTLPAGNYTLNILIKDNETYYLSGYKYDFSTKLS